MGESVVEVHDRALSWAEKRHGQASRSHRYAFASAVAELVTGVSYGIGPTVRVYAVIHAACSRGDSVAYPVQLSQVNYPAPALCAGCGLYPNP